MRVAGGDGKDLALLITLVEYGCIAQDAPITFVFADGCEVTPLNDGKPNCDGTADLFTGITFPYKYALLNALRKQKVKSICVALMNDKIAEMDFSNAEAENSERRPVPSKIIETVVIRLANFGITSGFFFEIM